MRVRIKRVIPLAGLLSIFCLVLYERYILSNIVIVLCTRNSFQLGSLSILRMSSTSETSINRMLPLPCQASQDIADTNWNDSFSINIQTNFFKYLALHLRNTGYPGIETYVQYVIALKNLKELKGVKPLRREFGMVINDVNFNYTLSVNSCRTSLRKLSVFIAITSAPDNFERRQMIRQTWLRHRHTFSHQLDVVEAAFILGFSNKSDIENAIALEHEIYGDILQVNMFDTYYDLSLKDTALFNWLDKNCRTVDFVLKVDDDVYVNFDNLIRTVKLIEPTIPAFYGWCGESLPRRDGKWAISYDNWPWSTYPEYLLGPATLITHTAIKPWLAAAQTIPYHPIDDIFVSGLCTEKARIQVFSSSKFFALDAGYKIDPCQVRQLTTWLTYSSAHMESSHMSAEGFYNGSNICDKPIMSRKNETIILEELLYRSFIEGNSMNCLI